MMSENIDFNKCYISFKTSTVYNNLNTIHIVNFR